MEKLIEILEDIQPDADYETCTTLIDDGILDSFAILSIVGESGSGKSVFTKTFAGMLDSNGFIDNGKIIFSDEELSDTVVKLNDNAKKVIAENKKKLDEYSRLEFGADTYKAILELESEKRRRADISQEEAEVYEKELLELKHERTNTFNLKQTYDPSKERA